MTCHNAKAFVMEDLSDITSDDVERVISSLPQWRREKTLAISYERGRREHAMAFFLLREVLRDVYRYDNDIMFDYSQHGKPILRGEAGICFNISHCANAVACVVSDSEVGIDVERRGRFMDGLARDVCNDMEYRCIMESEDPDMAFTSLWTRKEAMLKLTGAGVSSRMKDVLDSAHGIVFTTMTGLDYVCTVAEKRKDPI